MGCDVHMHEELLAVIDRRIEESTAELAADTICLVNIKSVRGAPEPGAPFGAGPKKVLDAFCSMAEASGFHCVDYGVGVVSAAVEDREPDLGIWLHGDVVPEGDGWNYAPYQATQYQGCIIGRGATDNKGQLAAVFNLLKIFQDLGIRLNYNPAIYVGSNEETGMADLVGISGSPDAKGFLNVATPPKLSLVPDSGFPVGYGGKGSVTFTLRSKTPLCGFCMHAGRDASPGKATAVFRTMELPVIPEGCAVAVSDHVELSASTPPRHGSKPDPNGNMITRLSAALLDSGLASGGDRDILSFFKEISLDVNGKALGIATEHPVMGPLVVSCKTIETVDGYPELTINIRYPLGISFEEMVKRVDHAVAERGFERIVLQRGVDPYMLDPDSKIIRLLLEASESVTHAGKQPFTIGGGTYAHRLPNAYVFGMNGNQPPADFPKGRGGAHGIDECVSLQRLKRAMRIYARALLALNEQSWED